MFGWAVVGDITDNRAVIFSEMAIGQCHEEGAATIRVIGKKPEEVLFG
jgi:hypothetical protein